MLADKHKRAYRRKT